MQGWALEVADGLATPDQETEVAAAYAQYQLAMKTAQSAYSAAEAAQDTTVLDQVLASVQASQTNLVALINSLAATRVPTGPTTTNQAPTLSNP
jgi:hypothetical protein